MKWNGYRKLLFHIVTAATTKMKRKNVLPFRRKDARRWNGRTDECMSAKRSATALVATNERLKTFPSHGNSSIQHRECVLRENFFPAWEPLSMSLKTDEAQQQIGASSEWQQNHNDQMWTKQSLFFLVISWLSKWKWENGEILEWNEKRRDASQS